MRKCLFIGLVTLLLMAGASSAAIHLYAQQQQAKPQSQQPMADCPMMKKHEVKGMNERGDQGMGFSQAKTTHHFFLKKDGGVIQVEANDAQDAESRHQIRQHLEHIAMMFADGNFNIPMFVHDRTPPGVPEMQKWKASISYKFEETERGGRVLITSANKEAVTVIQNFLHFQITEHVTGDSLKVDQD